MLLAEKIDESPVSNSFQCISFLVSEEHVTFPENWIVDIARVGSDIEITAEEDIFSRRTILIEVSSKPTKPVQFVGELIRAYCRTVWNVDIDHPDWTNRGFDKPALTIWRIIREGSLNFESLFARENSHTVVCDLTKEGRVVPELTKVVCRKALIAAFRFLQADDVGLPQL